MDEARYTRLETRVDEIKDTVSKVEAKQELMGDTMKEIKEDFHEHTQTIKEHVTGDTKIIKEIQPLLDAMPHLTNIAERYKFEEYKKKERKDKLSFLSKRLGLTLLILSIFVSLTKLL